MPRLSGRWCKAVIDSFHHRNSNVTRFEIISQLLSRNYFRNYFLLGKRIRETAIKAELESNAGDGNRTCESVP
jgi:hypothetical protein